MYLIEVERDGRWWMVKIPAIDGLTQARRINEVEQMAREYIAIDQGVPMGDVEIVVSSINVPGVGDGDVRRQADWVISMRTEAQAAATRASAAMAKLAGQLIQAGIPVRDIAELIDVSPQRVSQVTAP